MVHERKESKYWKSWIHWQLFQSGCPDAATTTRLQKHKNESISNFFLQLLHLIKVPGIKFNTLKHISRLLILQVKRYEQLAAAGFVAFACHLDETRAVIEEESTKLVETSGFMTKKARCNSRSKSIVQKYIQFGTNQGNLCTNKKNHHCIGSSHSTTNFCLFKLFRAWLPCMPAYKSIMRWHWGYCCHGNGTCGWTWICRIWHP